MVKKVQRRKNREIRNLILSALKKAPKDINQICREINVNWRTIKHHLIFLKGLDLVYEKFRHKQLRIFDITKEGKEFIKK